MKAEIEVTEDSLEDKFEKTVQKIEEKGKRRQRETEKDKKIRLVHKVQKSTNRVKKKGLRVHYQRNNVKKRS